nr:Chain C, synthetic peptide NRLMLTG [synthetic construct]4EZX_D Chain D, synthetic peptide NRLMLTG [synthetic construct]
NRLMLTG